MEKIATARWHKDQQLVITRLSGVLNADDITFWKESLTGILNDFPDNTRFKILIDLYGFKAENFEVHKKYRSIMPLLLADYGYRIGYLDMFPEAEVELKNTRGIHCTAMANVHQDESKMKDYQQKFSKPHERYFTDSAAALEWILSV